MMQATNSPDVTGHNRYIHITGIDIGPLDHLTIEVRYMEDGQTGRSTMAVTLDSVIIPAIVKALNGGGK